MDKLLGLWQSTGIYQLGGRSGLDDCRVYGFDFLSDSQRL